MVDRRLLAIVVAGVVVAAGCSGSAGAKRSSASSSSVAAPPADEAPASTVAPLAAPGTSTTAPGPTTTGAPSTPPGPLSGMPAPLAPHKVYGADVAGPLSGPAASARPLVYVPNNDDGTVTVIDQATHAVVDTVKVGKLPQHVVPSWDLRTLYVNVSGGNQVVPVDPATGEKGAPIPVNAPYNLYFTPDGRFAVVMAERLNRIDYYDRQTWQVVHRTDVPCRGVNHADWSEDGRWFLATCEFSGQLLKVDTETGNVLGVLDLPAGAMPQDIRLAPDGTAFFVADMTAGGVYVIDGEHLAIATFIPTGTGAHGIYPSRDGTKFYVSNRGRKMGDEKRRSHEGDGSVSVLDPAARTVVATWAIPGGGSPDMGGVSADGKELWLSGRYDAQVYVFDTTSGALTARIPVGHGPHGLCVWPQPGRYSLGHTGNLR